MRSEIVQALLEFDLDLFAGREQRLPRRDVVCFRKDREPRYARGHFARQRIEIRQRLDFVIEQLDPYSIPLRVRRKYIDDIPTDAVGALREVQFVALVLQLREPPQNRALIDPIAADQVQHHAEVGFRIAQAVD